MKRRLFDFLYNMDRAAASLFGAPPQETISSEIGRSALRGEWWGRVGNWALDRVQKDHCKNAVRRANALDATAASDDAKGLG